MTPCLFSFDMCPHVFAGFATGKKWNGFDEVAVDRRQLAAVLSWGGEVDNFIDDETLRAERADWEASFAKGELATLSGWTVYLIDRRALQIAFAFAANLREQLAGSADLFGEMCRLNENETSGGVCHSHDFCDANMPMDDAFTAIVGHELEAADEADCALWNDAWGLARSLGMIEATGGKAPTEEQTLCAEYRFWLIENGAAVPDDWDHSADELVLHDDWFTLEQRQWLSAFIDRWEAAMKREDAARLEQRQ